MDQHSTPKTNTKMQGLLAWFRRLAVPSQERDVQTNLKKMCHPIFALMGKGMEARFPTSDSFGKFGQLRQSDAVPPPRKFAPEQIKAWLDEDERDGREFMARK